MPFKPLLFSSPESSGKKDFPSRKNDEWFLASLFTLKSLSGKVQKNTVL
jgi:hypothetical protein